MAETKVLRIGIVGFGTVGTGLAKILLEDARTIADRTGIRLELVRVADKDISSPRKITLPEGMLTET